MILMADRICSQDHYCHVVNNLSRQSVTHQHTYARAHTHAHKVDKSVWYLFFAFSRRRLLVVVDIKEKRNYFCNLESVTSSNDLCFHLRWYNDKMFQKYGLFVTICQFSSLRAETPSLLSSSPSLTFWLNSTIMLLTSRWPCCKLWKEKKRTCSKKNKKIPFFFFSLLQGDPHGNARPRECLPW